MILFIMRGDHSMLMHSLPLITDQAIQLLMLEACCIIPPQSICDTPAFTGIANKQPMRVQPKDDFGRAGARVQVRMPTHSVKG